LAQKDPNTATGQVPGVYHRRIGDVLVTALSDGFLDISLGALHNIDPEQARTLLEDRFERAPPRCAVNTFLIRAGGRTAIIDTGSGDTMGPTLGRLPASLAAIGLTRADIDTVLLTHLHPDHSNGLTAADGTRLFPNAQLYIGNEDVAHWHSDEAKARASEDHQRRYFMGARFQYAPYRDRAHDASGDVFPNVSVIPLPGHTPGHRGYLIESGGEQLLIWGDICHVPGVQLARPDVTMLFDTDSAAAAATRQRVLDWVATDRLLVAGMHLNFPGLVHVVRRGSGYAAEPEVWRFDG
jgi:glyoxylase-like metal-dependent hydrolase (beta-lactamase superfamily II)